MHLEKPLFQTLKHFSFCILIVSNVYLYFFFWFSRFVCQLWISNPGEFWDYSFVYFPFYPDYNVPDVYFLSFLLHSTTMGSIAFWNNIHISFSSLDIGIYEKFCLQIKEISLKNSEFPFRKYFFFNRRYSLLSSQSAPTV